MNGALINRFTEGDRELYPRLSIEFRENLQSWKIFTSISDSAGPQQLKVPTSSELRFYRIRPQAVFPGEDLSGFDLSGASVVGVDLRGGEPVGSTLCWSGFAKRRYALC